MKVSNFHKSLKRVCVVNSAIVREYNRERGLETGVIAYLRVSDVMSNTTRVDENTTVVAVINKAWLVYWHGSKTKMYLVRRQRRCSDRHRWGKAIAKRQMVLWGTGCDSGVDETTGGGVQRTAEGCRANQPLFIPAHAARWHPHGILRRPIQLTRAWNIPRRT